MGLPFSKIIQNGQVYDVKVDKKPDFTFTGSTFLNIMNQIAANVDVTKITKDSKIVNRDNNGLVNEVYNVSLVAMQYDYIKFAEYVWMRIVGSVIEYRTLHIDFIADTDSSGKCYSTEYPQLGGNITGSVETFTNNAVSGSFDFYY